MSAVWSAAEPVDEWEEVDSIGRGVDANADWPATEKLFLNARWIVSNTGDRGYELSAGDRVDNGAPQSFPAKLTKLLYARFAASRPAPTLFPCELIEGNGDKLKVLAINVAAGWGLPDAFGRWLAEECVWVNSLVDRIVSAPLEPAGAVAEPYSLWAVENRPGLVMPCRHPERRRHQRSQALRAAEAVHPQSRPHLSRRVVAPARRRERTRLVRGLLAEPATLAELNDLYEREVLPAFDELGMGDEARAYRG